MIKREAVIKKYLNFFKKRKHLLLSNMPAVIIGKKNQLFVEAGVEQITDYILGKKEPAGKRLCNLQKCVRIKDITEIGDNYHHSFFEMLGNWSIGDYWKREAIEWAFELLTNKKEGFGLDPQRIYVTIFLGNKTFKKDKESLTIWKNLFSKTKVSNEIGFARERANKNARIFLFEENLWYSPYGLCGPCTEIFYDISPEKGNEKKTFCEYVDSSRYIEIWNNVFMLYRKGRKKYSFLKQKCIDSGLGVERILFILNNLSDSYATDSFIPLINFIESRTNNKYKNHEKDFRIVIDHIRTLTFVIGDSILIGGLTQKHKNILNSLLKNLSQSMYNLSINKKDSLTLSKIVINFYRKDYPSMYKNRNIILNKLDKIESFI